MKDINPRKKMCFFLEKKLALFDRYLSITKRMKKALKDKEAVNPGIFISERQNCINEIEKVDASIENIINTSTDKMNNIRDKFSELINTYLSSIKSIMKTVDLIDRKLMVMVEDECQSKKKELLNMRNFQQGTRGYKKETRYTPRFLDTIR